MATILAPNKSHNGITAGVRFTAGVGHTDRPAALTYFARAGYMILSDESTPPAEPTAAPVEEVLRRVNGEPYVLAADGSVRSPFAPGPSTPVAPQPARAAQRRTPRRAGRK